jgi:hypothetical protein
VRAPRPEAPVTSTVHSSTPYARAPLVPDPPAPSPSPPAPASPPAKPAAGDVVERLATLADLRERGMLDDDEYERAKRAVLGEETP